MPNGGGLQLLPETRKKIEIITPGENRLLVLGSIILILIAIISGVLYFYKNSLENKILSLDTEITSLEQKRDKKAEQNILVFNKQLSMLSDLLNKHNYWTTGFSKIEGLTQNQIQFSTITAASSDNKIDMKAVAANYTAIARQIAAFNSEESITDVSLNKITTLTNGTLEFTMQIIFDRNKFLKNK